MPLHRLPLDDWFDDVPHPHDTMPIATDVGEWLPENGDEPPDLAPSSVEPSEVSNTPEGGGTTRKDQLKDVTIHEKMYKIATDKYNPFAIGGSESIHDFD